MRMNPQKVRLVMARKCITAEELQQTIPAGTLGGLVSGRRNCRPATAGKLAQALGVDVLDILEESSI